MSKSVFNLLFREIKQKDNRTLASIIRTVLEDFGVNQPGTVYTDPTTDNLFELFQKKRSIYHIAEVNGKIIGGCGIFPTEGLPKNYGELVKLYLDKAYRNKGIGKELMLKCIHSAIEMGYKKLYLESLPELNQAIDLYKKVGFKQVNERLGSSGHFACNLWMVKDL